MGVADGVRQHDLIHAGIRQALAQRHGLGGRHHAVDRAAERGRGARDHRHSSRLRLQPGHDLAHHLDRLRRCAVQVGLAVTVADRDRDADLVHAGMVGVLHAAQVRRQRLHRQAGNRRQHLRHHLGRVGKLRDDPRRDEAADLDLLDSGGGDGGDPAHLVVRGHAGLGDLQPVARADLTDGDEVSAHGLGTSAIRMLPVSDSVMTSRSPSGVKAQLVVIRPAQDWIRYSGTPCGSMTQTQPCPGLEI